MLITAIYVNTESDRIPLSFQDGIYVADGVRLFITESKKDGVCAYTVQAESTIPFDRFAAVEIHVKASKQARYSANYRHSPFWCKPAFCDTARDIPPHTQCLFLKEDTTTSCILPVCSAQYLSQIKGTDDNSICVYMQSLCAGMHRCEGLAFTVAVGEEPYVLAEQCAAYALELLGTGVPLRRERQYPALFEYLGWCSWDAFMTDVSEQKLLQKCEEFKEKGIPIKWAIIDDMWGDVPGLEKSVGVSREEMFRVMHNGKLASFKADAKRFPNGLAACVKKINAFGIDVGMWHPTTGYWKGIDPNGEIASELSDALVTTKRIWNDDDEEAYEFLVPAPTFDKAFLFYDTWHSFFKECGVNFVKVDNQSFVHTVYRDALPLGEAASNLHKAIEASTEKHFGNTLINCMGAAAENMWNRPSSCVSRCSDDFQPENRDWFTKHILQCAYNCLVQGVFHVCDWDMWWTDDSQAEKNAVLRAISGGPIYVSDTLQRSRAEVLKPLCFDDGRILRADRPATPIEKCIFQNPENSKEPFIIWSKVGEGAVVAAFNLDKENSTVNGCLRIEDISELQGDAFVVYDYFAKSARNIYRDQAIELALADRDDFRLFTILPKTNSVTFIGLTDKMNSAKAIVKQEDNAATLYQGGEIAFVSDRDIQTVLVNGQPFTPSKNGILYTVSADCQQQIHIEV